MTGVVSGDRKGGGQRRESFIDSNFKVENLDIPSGDKLPMSSRAQQEGKVPFMNRVEGFKG